MVVSASILRHRLKKLNLSDYIGDIPNSQVENDIHNFQLSMKQGAASIDIPYQP